LSVFKQAFLTLMTLSEKPSRCCLGCRAFHFSLQLDNFT